MYLIQKRKLMVLALCSVMLFTACPKVSQSSLDKAAHASDTIATRYVETVDFVTNLYRASAISPELKDKLMDALIAFGQNGKKFNDLLKSYSAQYANGQVPPNAWTTIATIFDVLSGDFLKVLAFLPQTAGLGDSKAFRAISAAVMALAQVLATSSIIPSRQLQQLEREVAKYGLD